MQTIKRPSAGYTLNRLQEIASASFVARKDPLKRAFDLAFSAIVLVAALPFLGLIALAVRISSPGPILFRSKRLGMGGRVICCTKFRTMYQDAEERLETMLSSDATYREEWEIFQKLKNDPRVTAIGKFLRRTSLDELPQFWDVLMGNLSVVGPRPLTLMGPAENYLQEISAVYGRWTAIILSVRPGITGIWQVSGRSQIPIERRIALEAEYALHRTFLQDLLVIAKTIPAVLFSRGAF